MYRAYSLEEKKWLRDGIYLSPAPMDELFVLKRASLGREKLSLASSKRYVLHRDIGLPDANGNLIFEGDICRIPDKEVVGFVAYIPDHAAYCLLDDKNAQYYPLGDAYCARLEVVGNVLENKLEDFYNGVGKEEAHEGEDISD